MRKFTLTFPYVLYQYTCTSYKVKEDRLRRNVRHCRNTVLHKTLWICDFLSVFWWTVSKSQFTPVAQRHILVSTCLARRLRSWVANRSLNSQQFSGYICLIVDFNMNTSLQDNIHSTNTRSLRIWCYFSWSINTEPKAVLLFPQEATYITYFRWPGFEPKSGHVRFVVDKVAMRQVCPDNSHSTDCSTLVIIHYTGLVQ
jgi:hypothetical protein